MAIADKWKELFHQLERYGGAIVLSSECSEMEIAFAMTEGRMFANDDGIGFVRREQRWLDLDSRKKKTTERCPSIMPAKEFANPPQCSLQKGHGGNKHGGGGCEWYKRD